MQTSVKLRTEALTEKHKSLGQLSGHTPDPFINFALALFIASIFTLVLAKDFFSDVHRINTALFHALFLHQWNWNRTWDVLCSWKCIKVHFLALLFMV